MKNNNSAMFKYDFSRLSKNRMKTYARVVAEFEKTQRGFELDENDLDMLAAAGPGEYKNPQDDDLL
ncbi:MAG: hypothetical protein Q4B54_04105 [Coriobacteriales bacterium]|nr:hypothetical protein [Coriobacteriales bacterium]